MGIVVGEEHGDVAGGLGPHHAEEEHIQLREFVGDAGGDQGQPVAITVG
jgi:hypothetical protein